MIKTPKNYSVAASVYSLFESMLTELLKPVLMHVDTVLQSTPLNGVIDLPVTSELLTMDSLSHH